MRVENQKIPNYFLEGAGLAGGAGIVLPLFPFSGKFGLMLVEAYPAKHFEKIFKQVGQEGNVSVVWHLLSLFVTLSGTESGSALVASQMPILPDYFLALASAQQQNPPVNAAALKQLLQLESMFPQGEEWVASMGRILTGYDTRKYVNEVLVRVVLGLEKQTPLAVSLLLSGRDHLQKRVNHKPQPPANWSRPLPDTRYHTSLWRELEGFMRSPTAEVLDFRRIQQERKELESAILSVEIDLRTETIRKGSPHTLRITKTQAAYERQLAEWGEDVVLLEKVKKKTT